VTILTFPSVLSPKTIFAPLDYFPLKAVKGKSKAIPVQAWTGHYASKRLRLPEFLDNGYIKIARLSTLCTSCLYAKTNPWYSFLLRLSEPQSHSVAG